MNYTIKKEEEKKYHFMRLCITTYDGFNERPEDEH